MQFTKKKDGFSELQVTEDIRCIVHWHLMRNEFNRKRLVKHKGTARISQKLKPLTNQYRYEGYIQGDNKRFFSDNPKLVQRLTYNHALQLMKKRIKAYTQVLEGVTHG